MQVFDFKKEVPEAFPVINAGQIAEIAEVVSCKTYRNGDISIRAGETSFIFLVVKFGAIDFIDRSSSDPQTLLTRIHRKFNELSRQNGQLCRSINSF